MSLSEAFDEKFTKISLKKMLSKKFKKLKETKRW